jgi:plastocyanin
VRRSRHAVAACALGTALLVPAIPLAIAQDQPGTDAPRPTLTPGNVRPDAALSSTQAGGKVTFDASKSVDSDGSIVAYEWDLDGDSVYETKTQGEPRAEHTYDPGTTLIASVRITDDAGASDDATDAVVVAAAPADPTPAAPAATPSDAPLVPTDNLSDDSADTPEPRSVKSTRETETEPADDKADPTVVAAANGAVTIKDFEFVQTSVTVSVGDSVTWLNQGPTAHTATANDGSFDSGNLSKGKSYSHKFTKAGTFSYFCKPHPFMKAKVVVTGAGSSGSGGSDSGGSGGSGSSGDDSSGTAGAGADSGSGDSLAKTGVDLIPWALFGFSLLAFGAAMRYTLTAE